MPLTHDDIALAYRRHAHSVLRRATRLLGSEPEAQEVLHEVFVSLLEQPTQFAAKSSLLTWLYASTTHSCLKRLRAKATRQRLLAANAEAVTPGIGYCAPDDEVELRRVLKELPEELATVAVYHFVDALTYEEMADVLHCSRRKVGYLMERLREWVNGEEGTLGTITA